MMTMDTGICSEFSTQARCFYYCVQCLILT